MGSNYVFSLQPTFTQGLILGQVSILFLLALILKYLFIDSSESPVETSSYHPRLDNESSLRGHHKLSPPSRDTTEEKGAESAEWFNMLLQQVSFSAVEMELNKRHLAIGC
jgi:maintenance of mitochondrial morphology protein 1